MLFLCVFLGVIEAQEYKAVFDCSSEDPRYVLSRMNLVEKTATMIESGEEKVDFALTLHGGCVPMVSKAYGDIVDDTDMIYVKKAQETLMRLSKKEGVRIIVCAMSLENNGIEKDEVVSFVDISKNSFIDTIAYQNRGYAIMTFK